MTRRPLRMGRGVAIMAVIALVVLVGRALWANGLFSSVPTGFLGSCTTLANVPGIEDFESANGLTFVSVGSARGSDPRDGLYLLKDGKLARLDGGPKDFHPRGIGLLRAPGGALYLYAVNKRNSGRFSVDSFEVSTAAAPRLVPQGTIEGGLLTDPQDVVAAGPGAFYVSNNNLKSNWSKQLAAYALLPGSEVLYFNGMTFQAVADGLYGARGLLLAPDRNHLLVASLTTRSIKSFNRDVFTGALSEAGSLTLAAAPEKLSLDHNGEVWAAGHASLLRWRAFGADKDVRDTSQVFRVALGSGVPQEAEQVYGNDGEQIAAASIALSSGKTLLIGSSLDTKFLSCAQK